MQLTIIVFKLRQISRFLAFERTKAGEKVVYVANLSDEPVDFTLELDENLQPFVGKQDFMIQQNQQYSFGPWEYVILSDN